MKPQIVISGNEISGFHNNAESTIARLEKAGAYKDLSTIMIVPTRGMIPAKCAQTWMNLAAPMNQKFLRMFAIGMEVGQAYNTTINQILANEELSKWKYILTVEEDNALPSDGLLKLYENMDKFDAIGGLYWTKGRETGMPMIYGNPAEHPINFKPQMPIQNAVQECNGLGMGFTLFKMDMFKDPKFNKDFFRTVQENGRAYTQDLYFFERAKGFGYRFACDNRVLVGHYAYDEDFMY